jgi:hypothetical protein
VIPSGAQNAIGGELRLPFDLPGGRALDVRGEAYFVENNTREAVEGFLETNTERFGRVKGLGWYGLVSFWACGDTFVSDEPGIHRPVQGDPENTKDLKRGFEVLLVASGVNASYSGATRVDSKPDANTPDADVTVYQFGAAAQYWYGTLFRAGFSYDFYFAPNSGDPGENLAQVPEDLPHVHPADEEAHESTNVHHEVAFRTALTF